MGKNVIFYIGAFSLPDKNAAAHRVIANGKAFRDLGYDVVFIGTDFDEPIKNEIEEKNIYFGFDCYKRRRAKTNLEWINFLTNIKPYKQIIEKYTNPYAIVGYNLPALVLLNLKKEARKRSIKIFSDCTEWYEIKKKGNSLFKFLIRYLDVYLRMKIINSKLDGVIAISKYLQNYYRNKGVRTVQIPPLVDTSDEKWKNDCHQPAKNIQLFYAGTPFSLYKEPSYKDRIDIIIQSLYELKKNHVLFEMHIAGIEKEEVTDNFPRLCVAINFLNDSLKFYGKLSHLQVINMLKSADYSLFLRYNSKSVRAGFPTKFVESISCGVPVLTNRNSNVGDYLREGINGYWIEISNIEGLTDSLKRALSEKKDKISEMKENCFNSKMFDYRNYISVFENFLSEKSDNV